MSESEIVDKIIKQLRFNDERGGYFHQEPYKGDFFDLFVEASKEGDGLRADRMTSIIGARAPELFDGKNWPLLLAAWGEWDYVWDKVVRSKRSTA